MAPKGPRSAVGHLAIEAGHRADAAQLVLVACQRESRAYGSRDSVSMGTQHERQGGRKAKRRTVRSSIKRKAGMTLMGSPLFRSTTKKRLYVREFATVLNLPFALVPTA